MTTKNKLIIFVLLTVQFLLFIAGGSEIKIPQVITLGLFVSFVSLVISTFWKDEFKLPKGTLIYILYLLVFLANLFWTDSYDTAFKNFLLYLSGGLFWVVSFNMSDVYAKHLSKILIFLGLVFGGLYFYTRQAGIIPVEPFSLFSSVSSHYNHNHIGDYWALLFIPALVGLRGKKKGYYAILLLLGTYFLSISFSRSAYVALLVGVIYFYYKKGPLKKYRRFLWGIAAFILLLFVLATTQKTLLFSRPYWTQGVLGVIHNPMGVGYGNFGIISQNPVNHIWNLTGFSKNAHNIFLEILTGMGLLGVVFIIFFVDVARELTQKGAGEKALYQAIFVILSTNFFFDFTYHIPTMLWLWFLLLGLFQTRVETILGRPLSLKHSSR